MECAEANPNPQSAIRNPQSTGFTLIELLLVLVILATLAAIVTPRLTGQSKRAKVTAAHTQIADMGTALDAFEIEVGRYPTTVEGLRALVEQPTSEAEDWQQPYLNKKSYRWTPGATSTTTGIPASTTRTAMTCTATARMASRAAMTTSPTGRKRSDDSGKHEHGQKTA